MDPQLTWLLDEKQEEAGASDLRPAIELVGERLEINGFSFSCFYACDLEAIVRAAHEEALREWQAMQM